MLSSHPGENRKAFRLDWVIFVIGWFMICENGYGETPRLAIVPTADEPSLNNLADTLTAHLSGNLDFDLVERAEIDEIAHEKAISIQEVGTLLSADGLVSLTSHSFGDSQEVWLRFIDVQTGAILAFNHSEKPSLDLDQWLREVGQILTTALPNLSAQGRKITTFSILNFRAEAEQGNWRDWEQGLLTGISRRLVAEPGIQVLERWRLDQLAWEKGIRIDPGDDFLTGSVLLDGSFTTSPEGKVQLTVNARQGAVIHKIELEGSTPNLTELADKAAQQILDRYVGKQIREPWDLTAEANEFVAEAQWALRIGAYREAAYAAETSWALGLQTRELLLIRIAAHSHLGYSGYRFEKSIHFAHLPDAYNLDSTATALQNCQRYLERFGNSPLTEAEVKVIAHTLQGCLNILLANCESDTPNPIPDQLHLFRHHASSIFLALLNSPVEHAKIQWIYQLNALYQSVLYETAAETLEGYDRLLKYSSRLKDPWDRAHLLGLIIGGRDHHTVERQSSVPKGLITTNTAAVPWIVSRSQQGREANLDAWNRFLEARAKSDRLADRLEAYSLLIPASQSYTARSRAIDNLFTFLTDHTGEIFRSEDADYFARVILQTLYERMSPLSGDQKSMENFRSRLFDVQRHFLTEFLTSEEPPVTSIFLDFITYLPFHGEENAVFGKELYRLTQTYIPSPGQDSKLPGKLEKIMRRLERAGITAPEPKKEPALVLDNYVIPVDENGRKIDITNIGYDNRDLWTLTNQHLVQFSLPSCRQEKVIPLPEPHRHTYFPHRKIAISDHHVLTCRGGAVDLFDKRSGEVNRVAAPREDYDALFHHQGKFILGYQGPFRRFNPARNGGIYRLDPETGEIEILASSRRRPSQNILDDQPGYGVYQFFADAQGSLYAALRQSKAPEYVVYRWNESDRSWTLVFSREHPLLMTGSGEDLLCFDAFRKIADIHLLKPAGWKTIPLLDTAPDSRWQLLTKEKLNMSGREYDYCATYQNETLWYAGGESGSQSTNYLIQYGGAAGKPGQQIPLVTSRGSSKFPNHIIAVPTGLILWRMGTQGFWYIDQKDLEKYHSTR